MSESEIRSQIDFLRFFMIVGLVLLHYGNFPGSDLSPFRGFRETDYPIAAFVNSYMLFFFLNAVPTLSTISGYLFFRNCDFSRRFYFDRYRSRTKSILLPMISWNAIVLLLFLVIHASAPESKLESIVKYDLDKLGLPQILNALVGVTRHPINFQFWFLRDLFLVVLASPLLGLLIRRAPWFGLAGLAVVWMGDYKLGIFFRPDILFFFYVGGLIRVRGWSIKPLSEGYALTALAIYAGLVGVRVMAEYLLPPESYWSLTLLAPATRLLRLLGVVAFWSIAPLLLRTLTGRLVLRVGTLAFFLHAIHWPMNQFMKEAIATLWPGSSDAAFLLNYFATSIGTILLAILSARLLDAALPSVFKHLSGGRSGIWVSPSPRPVLQ